MSVCKNTYRPTKKAMIFYKIWYVTFSEVTTKDNIFCKLRAADKVKNIPKIACNDYDYFCFLVYKNLSHNK